MVRTYFKVWVPSQKEFMDGLAKVASVGLTEAADWTYEEHGSIVTVSNRLLRRVDCRFLEKAPSAERMHTVLRVSQIVCTRYGEHNTKRLRQETRWRVYERLLSKVTALWNTHAMIVADAHSLNLLLVEMHCGQLDAPPLSTAQQCIVCIVCVGVCVCVTYWGLYGISVLERYDAYA